MKVMLIGSDVGVSGAGFSMTALAEELEKQGTSVVLVVRTGETEKRLSSEGVPHYVVDCRGWTEPKRRNYFKRLIVRQVKKVLNIKNYIQLLHLVEAESPDIIHVNTCTTYVPALVALAKKKKLVWHFREMVEEDFESQFWSEKKAIKLFRKADAIICISRCVFEKFNRKIKSNNLHVVYNGVDVRKYLNLEHRIFTSDRITITIAGRIHENKGQMIVLRAFSQLIDTIPNVDLVIVGSGSAFEEQRIHDYIESSNLDKARIKLLGHVKDMYSVWGKTDIAIVASKCEAFGRVTVEAMCGGCLVIGANSGGTKELLENGRGLIFEANDERDLVKKIQFAIENQEESISIASSARTYATDVFTAENNAKQIAQIYAEINR